VKSWNVDTARFLIYEKKMKPAHTTLGLDKHLFPNTIFASILMFSSSFKVETRKALEDCDF
jgi:hypothetical protein